MTLVPLAAGNSALNTLKRRFYWPLHCKMHLDF